MKIYIYLLVVLTTFCNVNSQSVLNWLWKTDEPKHPVADGIPLIAVPYESLTEDEKFLKEAAKFVTDMQISSPLEICQHKVVLKIKNSCSSMSEEQLAKLSVNLLNCQSETEGRAVYPCTDDMSIKQCTMHMDSDTWNAYHLMSNRARAVCYASRNHQFRALTEITVNKLMKSAHDQIKTLESLKENQDRLEEQTISAHKIIESNIQELSDEKALIRAGHEQLAIMTEDIKNRLERASQEILQQARERNDNHQELIHDLLMIQSQAQQLWDKIESSTTRIIEQNNQAALQYEETLLKLEKMNETLSYVSSLTDKMRSEIDEKLGWIKEYIGSTGENLEKIYRITLHIIYIFGAMVVAAFLHAPFLTRTAILGAVPLNLAAYLKHGMTACLDFVSLTTLIILITAMHYLMNGIQYLVRSKTSNRNSKKYCVEQEFDISYVSGKKTANGDSKLHSSTKNQQEESKRVGFFQRFKNLGSYVTQKINQSLDNMKAFFMAMKSWVSNRIIPTEELSCSYVPAKTYQECIITGRDYPSISDDSSEFSDSRDSARFVVGENQSLTGAVLRRHKSDRYGSPLSAFFKGIRNPHNRETLRTIPKARMMSESIQTPASKALCGAKTRSGNPCRLVASKGQNFCHRHASGGSTISE